MESIFELRGKLSLQSVVTTLPYLCVLISHVYTAANKKGNLNKIIIIIIIIFKKKKNFIHRFKKIDYLQIQEYEILKYIPYVHSSCVRKRIVVKWLSKDY